MAHPSIDLQAWQAASHDPAVLIADGHDIRIMVRNGQLQVNDGPPGAKRTRTIAKVPRTVSRLLVLAGHGLMSIEAVRWLSWAGIPWSVLDTDTGQLIAISEQPATDARLLRAQSRAHADGDLAAVGQDITRYLLGVKLAGQADNLSAFSGATAANIIREYSQLPVIPEGKAAETYWYTWANRLAVPWSPTDLLKVPAHWSGFAQRPSLNGQQPDNADATDPVNAILNYLYRIAETECTHACLAYGLSPVLGISHTDKAGRDSMALDLLETARPVCERIVLDILAPDGVIPYVDGKPQYLDRRWFQETREGTCRILPPLTHRLSGYAAEIGEAVQPHAHKVAQMLAHAATGIVSVKRAPKPAKPTGIHRGAPLARLRPGTTARQIISDAVWPELRALLPMREAKGPGRSIKPPGRELLASIVIRYTLKCGWSDCPVVDKRLVNRWHDFWAESGTWGKAERVLADAGHLAALLA